MEEKSVFLTNVMEQLVSIWGENEPISLLCITYKN